MNAESHQLLPGSEVIRFQSGELSMRALALGSGSPVVLVHGFPDSALVWRKLAPLLVAAGYRVLMPDMRGYGESAMPSGKENYSLEQLGSDVLALLDHEGIERAALVGHDWGAAVCWRLAAHFPERFSSLAALSFGHPGAYLLGGFRQVVRAWYIFLFLVPWVAEVCVRAFDFLMLRSVLQHDEIERWVADLKRSGRLTAAMNWYRRNAADPTPIPKSPLPTLGVWSSGDVALTEVQMKKSDRFVEGAFSYQRIEGASQWIQLDAPEELASLLVAHFAANDSPPLVTKRASASE